MVVVHDYFLSVIMCIITMICWGSWANTAKLVDGKKWPFQLYYWDYCLGIVIFSIIFALTLGSFGSEGRSFFQDFGQASLYAVSMAVLGGIVFNLANVLIVAAIDLAGMAVAFPVGIGIALVLGVVVNYIGVPKGNPIALFFGVGCIVVAIILTAMAYGRLKTAQLEKGKGLIAAVLGGFIMGLFYRFVASSMSVNYTTPEAGLLTPYTALVLFSLGVFFSSFIWNVIIMKKPISGPVIHGGQYFQGTTKEHISGMLGGIIWSIGMSCSILASNQAGYAVSYGLGQGATMIAVIWGVFIWKEFAGAPQGTNKYILTMFIFYLIGIISIIVANTI